MSDIIFSYPWLAGDVWAKATVWRHDDGYTEDAFSDGDHIDLDEADLPTSAQVAKAWRDYAQYVAETGHDPLREYIVPRTKSARMQVWLQLKPHPQGVEVLGVRFGNPPMPAKLSDLPELVLFYFHAKPAENLLDVGWSVIKKRRMSLKPGGWARFGVDYKEDLDPEQIQRSLKAAARRHLAGA